MAPGTPTRAPALPRPPRARRDFPTQNRLLEAAARDGRMLGARVSCMDRATLRRYADILTNEPQTGAGPGLSVRSSGPTLPLRCGGYQRMPSSVSCARRSSVSLSARRRALSTN